MSSEDDGPSWGNIVGIPDWLKDAEDILKNPVAWLAGVLVGWIFDLWGAVLGFLDSMWDVLEGIPRTAIYEPVVGAFSPVGGMIQDLWRDIGVLALELAEPAGPFAPIVVVGFWAAMGVLAMSGVYFVSGFLGTYLPLNSLPIVRRLI